MFLWKRWKEEERNERPPQPDKILRPAGYFAMCKALECQERYRDDFPGGGGRFVFRPDGGEAGSGGVGPLAWCWSQGGDRGQLKIESGIVEFDGRNRRAVCLETHSSHK
jgi:hypothetical protein